MSLQTSSCPRNCYSTCSLLVRVEDGRVVAIEGHPENRATPEGPCLKGLSYLERIYSPERILTPLRRRVGGGFEPVSWDTALDLLAERLQDVRARWGPQAVLYYAGSGTKGLLNRVGLDFWRLFGGCTTTYGDLCWPAGLEATRLTLGENSHNAPWDLANARLIIMWGKNSAETNIHQMRFVDQAVAAGARFIVIDPRRTPTADRAHRLIQPRPGTDGALALGLARHLVDAGLTDAEFVARHVAGFEAFAAHLRESWPVSRAAAVSGVAEETLRTLAEELGSEKPATISAGFGMQRWSNGGQTIRAILSLLALTGNLGKPGAGWIYANLQSQIFDPVKDPLDLYPPEVPDGVVRVSISTALLGPQMLAQRDPPLKLAWVERGNPVCQNPETGTVLRAFRDLEFRVVVDERLTDTAREADLVLPSKSLFEQTDVIGAYWHPYVQLRPRLIDPPGEVRPESAVYWDLARRLGIPRDRVRDTIPEPGEEATRAWLERQLAPFPGLTLERLARGPVLSPAFEEIAFAGGRFLTPSGKVELWSDEAARRWGVAPLPDWTEPLEGGRGGAGDGSLLLLTPNTKNSIHSQFLHLRVIRQFDPGPALFLAPEDAAARGLRNGDPARVYNRRGELRLPVRIDLGMRPGCVAAYNGWGIQDGGAVNLLSAARETDMGHGAAFHDNRVEVERAP